MSLLAPGSLSITAVMDRGAVLAVDIGSDRPLSLASRFAGRPVNQAIAAVGLLHAVCGQSHAAALHFATEAASGSPLSDDQRRLWSVKLAAERIGEHLRELFIGESDEAFLVPVRDAIALAQSLARNGADPAHLNQLQRLIAALRPAFQRSPERAGAQAFSMRLGADTLTAADDPAILAALAASSDFPARPSLPGRCPEVGPAARLGGTAAFAGATRAARIREIDVALTESGAADLVPKAVTVRPGQGFAAVESPRGRLCYFVEVAEDRQLVAARVLAPTEWNFHPSGPFARALIGWRPEGEAPAAIARMAADFCPCVAVAINVTDTTHA